MKKLVKVVVRMVVALVALLLLLALLHPFILGPSIKAGVEKIGPMLTQTPITLGRAHVNLFRGVIELSDLKVDNPEGYKTDAAMRVGKVRIALAPLSVMTGTIRVKQVYIDAAEAWYEMGIPSSNIGRIQESVNRFAGDKKAVEKPASGEQPAKKVEIDDLQILNTRVHVGVKGLGGNALPILMPNIREKDLGKDGQGKSVSDMTVEIVASVLNSVTRAASGAGQAVGDAVSGAGKAVGETGKAVGEAGKAVGSGIRGLFGRDK
jgi:hypothetical protein